MLLDYILGGGVDDFLTVYGLCSHSPRALLTALDRKVTSMTFNGWLQILIYIGILLLLVKPLGGYMTRVFTGERTFLSFVLRPVERGFIVWPARMSAKSSIGRPIPSPCCCSASRASSFFTPCSDCKAVCHIIPPT